jgi:DnaJ-class molecular chaperone
MDFIAYPKPIPIRCPDCDGAGRRPYPFMSSCGRCGGWGSVERVVLTYWESYATNGQGCGQQYYAGEIERPFTGKLPAIR